MKVLSRIPIGVVVSIFLSLVWLYVLPDPHIPFYGEVQLIVLSFHQAIAVYAASSIIALCSESAYVLTQLSLHTNVKVFVESTALTVRSIVNCALLCLFPSLGLKGFCIGEVIFALCYPLLYLCSVSAM